MSGFSNIIDHLRARARETPDRAALISRKGRLSFSALEELSSRCASGLRATGVGKGTRVALLVRPGPELMTLAFALAKLRAVPVLVDPGIGRRHLRRCLDEAEPAIFIGVPKAVWAALLLGWGRRTTKARISVGRGGPPGSLSYARILHSGDLSAGTADPPLPEDPAAIAFTSGSTGPPKGVIYTHRMFSAQAALLQSTFGIEPGEVDLATFPLFALYDPALQMTTVFPEMDFSRPGKADPRKIVEAIETHGVTHLFGSPALLDRVGRYLESASLELKGIRRVLSAGAPVSPTITRRLAEHLPPTAEIHTPYGATEALPVTSISHRERERLGGTDQGKGVCVGRPLEGVHCAVIRISEDPIGHWSEELLVSPGEVGELVVWGPNVSAGYFHRPQADRMAKIECGGVVRHRMGDLGYFDDEGRFWFCGRKAHRVVISGGVLFSVMVEGVFNQHPDVLRTALVGIGRRPDQKPVLCVELERHRKQVRPEIVRRELLALGATFSLTEGVQTILFHSGFPVDIRHNAKIFREKLSLWAERRLR